MKYIKPTYWIFALVLIFSLLSCDPVSEYKYRIDNKSDSTLYVVYKRINRDGLIKISVEKQTSKLIDEHNEVPGGEGDYGDDFLRRYDSLGIFTDTINLTEITKNYLLRQSWNYYHESNGNDDTNTYKLEIKNEDLN